MSSTDITKEELIKTFADEGSYIHRDDLDELIKKLIEVTAANLALEVRMTALEEKPTEVK